jgi:hypothetical protein
MDLYQLRGDESAWKMRFPIYRKDEVHDSVGGWAARLRKKPYAAGEV